MTNHEKIQAYAEQMVLEGVSNPTEARKKLEAFVLALVLRQREIERHVAAHTPTVYKPSET